MSCYHRRIVEDNLRILIQLGLFLALAIVAAHTAFAQDTSGSRYAATERVETDQGAILPAGSVVDILGVIDVPTDVAASGRLLTFRFSGEVYTADFSIFAPVVTEANFEAAAVRSRNAGGRAEMCAILYSKPSGVAVNLNDADLAAFLKVEQNGRRIADYSLTLSSDTEFCIGGLEFSTDYQVTILRGLTFTGQPLAVGKDLTFSGRTPAANPSISLNSPSYILPVGERSLLPVTTVNLDEFTIELFRIDPRTLVNYPDLFSNLNGYEVRRVRDFYGESLGKRIIRVTNSNERQSFNLEVGTMIQHHDPGLFAAVFSSNKLDEQHHPTQWFVHSNLGVMTWSGVEETLVAVADFRTLASVPSARIQVLAGNNRILFSATSDTDGTLRIPHSYLAGSGGNAPKLMITTTESGDFSLLDVSDLKSKPRFLEGGIEKSYQEDIYLTVPREMFRSGDDLDFHVLAKDLKLAPLVNFAFDATLSDPRADQVAAVAITTNAHGVAAGKFSIEPTWLLGAYTLKVARKDGLVLAAREIRVDDFVPLTIEPSLDIGEVPWTAAGRHAVTIEAGYFSGGPARGRSGEFRTEVRAVRMHEAEELTGYLFGPVRDADYRFVTEVQKFELDDAGRFTGFVNLDEIDPLPHGMYQLRMLATVEDVGGRPNRTEAAVPLDTSASYVGVRPEFHGRLAAGAVAAFSVARIDRTGAALTTVDLPYDLVQVRHSYDWYYDSGWRWRRTRQADQIVDHGTSVNGRIVSSKPLDWGSYELVVKDGPGFRTVVPFYVGWGSDGLPASEPEQLATSVETDDGMPVLRASLPFAGLLRVQIAHTDVVAQKTVRVSKGDVEVPLDIEIPEYLEPGYHVLSTLVRPVAAGTEHQPQIALGSNWIQSLGAERSVGMIVGVAETIRSTDSVLVVAQTDVPTGSAVLYLIDEGIHALTGFRNEDPGDFFYGERELSIGFASNYGRLIQQDRNLRTYLVGGGDAQSVGLKSRFFATVAAVSPILPVNDGRVVHTFEQPDYEGRLRLVALVASDQGVGYREKTVTVRDPVSLDISLPRFIGTGDRVEGRLALRANEGAARVRLEERVGGAFDSTEVTLGGGHSMQSAIAIAAPASGQLPVEITAVYHDGVRAERSFEIEARSPSYPHTELRSIQVPPSTLFRGKTDVPPLTLPAFDLARRTDLEYRVTVSVAPGAGLGQLLAALDRYPYGCVEQVSSATRGLIFRERLTSEADAAAVDGIHRGIERIISMQKADGSFGYWDRFGSVVEQFQPYVVETLVFALPYANEHMRVAEAIDKGLRYLNQQSTNDIWTKLYSYGVLARGGYDVTSRARYSLDSELFEGVSNDAVRERLERISLGYWLADMLNDQRRMARLHDSLEQLLAQRRAAREPRRNGWDEALEFFSAGGRRWSHIAPNHAHLLAQVSADSRTPATAVVVQDTGAYLGALQYRSTYVNGKLAQMVLGNAASMAGAEMRIDGKPHRIAEDGTIDLAPDLIRSGFEARHTLTQPVYLNVEVVGPRRTVGPQDNGFQITKTWYDSSGRQIDLDRERLVANQGQLFTVVLDILPTERGLAGESLLTDLLPSGFEIEVGAVSPPYRVSNGRRQKIDLDAGKRPEFVENMDDRFVAHFSGRWLPSGSAVAYTVRAVYPGEMTIPDAHIEMMYQPEINGRSEVQRARIIAE